MIFIRCAEQIKAFLQPFRVKVSWNENVFGRDQVKAQVKQQLFNSDIIKNLVLVSVGCEISPFTSTHSEPIGDCGVGFIERRT